LIQIKESFGKVVLRFAFGDSAMVKDGQDAEGYEGRAEECVRLANVAQDKMVQAELLRLRQNYLDIASRLRTLRDN
jgi:hypothetical protein